MWGADSFMHRRNRGGGKGTMAPPKFLENVILCFERRFSKQNSVIRLKSNILALQIFGLAMTLGLWWFRLNIFANTPMNSFSLYF